MRPEPLGGDMKYGGFIALALALLLAEASFTFASDGETEECRKRLIQMQEVRILYDLDWQLPKEPKVVAGPNFFPMPFEAKEGFAETVNCFLAGEGKFVNFDVLHWRTGKAVGRFANGKLKLN